LTRGKAILIGVLSLVLVVVLYLQFGRSGKKPAFEPAGYRPPRPAVATKSPNAAPKHELAAAGTSSAGTETVIAPIIDLERWKSPPLETVIAYDPFALPASFPQPLRVAKDGKSGGIDGMIAAAAADDAKRLAEAIERLQRQLEELKQRGVHVIVRERDQYAAVIGDRMLHVGDEINGFTVTAIDPSGVHVERKDSP
jgi:hypothetical protein